MYKQVRCIDILRISNKLKIPINELTDDNIQNNIPDDKEEHLDELTCKYIQNNISDDKEEHINSLIDDTKIVDKNKNVNENLKKTFLISMSFNFLKYLSR